VGNTKAHKLKGSWQRAEAKSKEKREAGAKQVQGKMGGEGELKMGSPAGAARA
jgi:hypothetical protein